jgi:hypothetical protein
VPTISSHSMENASRNVEMVTMVSEGNVLLVTNHARLAPTTHFNALHALKTSSTQTDDASQPVSADNILMLFQEPANNAIQVVRLAVPNNSVPPVRTIKLSQSEDNACHAFTHAPAALPILVFAMPVKVDFTFPTETVSEAAHQELDQSMESVHALQD